MSPGDSKETTVSLKTPLCDILGVDHPVMLAGMGGVSYAELCAAVSEAGGFGSLAEVRKLFGRDELLLAGWVHYLAFDLFIGAWESRDSQRLEIPRLVMIPCYLMTFMLGPIGLLFYFAIRTAKTKSLEV